MEAFFADAAALGPQPTAAEVVASADELGRRHEALAALSARLRDMRLEDRRLESQRAAVADALVALVATAEQMVSAATRGDLRAIALASRELSERRRGLIEAVDSSP